MNLITFIANYIPAEHATATLLVAIGIGIFAIANGIRMVRK